MNAGKVQFMGSPNLEGRDAAWRSVVETFPGWMWTAFPDGSIEYASPGVSAYFSDARVSKEDLRQL
jgi:hypothetical protein